MNATMTKPCRCEQCGAVFDESKILHLDGNEGCPSCGAEECVERVSQEEIEEESWQSAVNPEPIL